MLGNVEFQSEIDSGTSTPKLDTFQTTISNSNTITDCSLTITSGKVFICCTFCDFCLFL